MIWRVHCKIYSIFFRVAKSPEIFYGMEPNFFLIYLMKLSFFSGCHPRKSQVLLSPWKNRVDFTGYPSNHFPRCRLNGQMSQKTRLKSLFIPIGCAIIDEYDRIVPKLFLKLTLKLTVMKLSPTFHVDFWINSIKYPCLICDTILFLNLIGMIFERKKIVNF